MNWQTVDEWIRRYQGSNGVLKEQQAIDVVYLVIR